MTAQRATPPWVWLLLAAAVCGVSSAGALFQHVDEVPPVLRASWRLQLTALVLAPLALWQWRDATTEIRQRCFSKPSLTLLMASGLALGAHFATWVASLDATTLTHSLLFVTAHPLVIVLGMALLSRRSDAVRRPVVGEWSGAAVCFVGAGLALMDAGQQQGDQTVTLWGDTLAFSGAVFVVGYIVVGRVLRQWMPIFLYAFPVTLIGAVVLLPASMALESDFAEHGAFGWTEPSLFGWFLLLALIAGLLGHTGLNTCLRYISPLVVSSSVTLEPLIGSLIGWWFFDAGVPGRWTLIGGAVLIAGLLMVVLAGESHAATQANPHESGHQGHARDES